MEIQEDHPDRGMIVPEPFDFEEVEQNPAHARAVVDLETVFKARHIEMMALGISQAVAN
jgi:hypothetical protein